MLIENVGIPFPIEATYLVAATLIKQGHSYLLILTLLTAGHLAGSLLAYELGRGGEVWLTNRWQHKTRFLKISESLRKWYTRYGNITVFATRFIGYVRPWSSLVAGFAGVEWRPFLFWTLTGTLLFNIIALEFTLYFLDCWNHFGSLFRYLAISLFLVSFSLIFIVQHFWHRQP